MARTGIHYTDVKQAAIQLLSQGIAPSVQKIRDKLGTGSNTTIADHLHTWREEYATKEIHHLPADMPKELISAIEILWQTAMEQATNQLSAIKHGLEEQKNQLQQEKSIIAPTLLELQSQVSRLQQALEVNNAQQHALQTEKAILEERLSAQILESTAMQSQYEIRLKNVVDEKEVALEQVDKHREENHQLQLQLNEQAEKHQLNMTQERQRQEHSENRWLTLIDQARTEAATSRKVSESALEKQQKQIDTLKNAVNDWQKQALTSDIVRKQAEKSHKTLSLQLAKLQSQYHDASGKVSALKAQLGASKKAPTKNTNKII